MKTKTNINIVFSILWISHFLIWSYSDFLSQLQRINEPASNQLLLFAAVPLGILQIFMIIFPHFGKPKFVRVLNLIIPMLFIVFNIGFLTEAIYSWQYLLGITFITINLLTVWCAWTWKQTSIKV